MFGGKGVFMSQGWQQHNIQGKSRARDAQGLGEACVVLSFPLWEDEKILSCSH